jgi:hypothetical protein
LRKETNKSPESPSNYPREGVRRWVQYKKMKIKRYPVGLQIIFLVFLATQAFFFVTEEKISAVPAAPNESIVIGIVKECTIISSRLINIQPDQALYRLTIHVESSESLHGGPNFVKSEEGRDVQLYSKGKIPFELLHKRLKMKVTYSGDERGGLLWISSYEIVD